jgi:hypothetical protein
MSGNINDIIANAKAQAQAESTATIVNDDSSTVIEQEIAPIENAVSTAVATHNPNAIDMSDIDIASLPAELQALLRGGAAPSNELGNAVKTTLGVDSWLQPSGMGLTAKDCDDVLRPFKASISYRKGDGVNKIKTVQIESTGPTGETEVTYVSTVDDEGIKGNDGRPWQISVIEAYTRATQNARKYPYDSAQMILIAEEDVLGFDGTVLFPKGSKFGHSTPRTGWNNFADLDQNIGRDGLIGKKVLIEVSNEKVTMKGRKPWGVLLFKLLGELPAPVEAEDEASAEA